MGDHLIPADLLVPALAPATRQVIVGATPAAGADWSVTVPGGNVWEVKGISALLTTSAAAGNRGPRLRVASTDGIVWQSNLAAAQAASLAWRYSWAQGDAYSNTAAGLGNNAPFPIDLYCLPGWTISVATAAIDVADQWTLIRLAVEQGYQGAPYADAAFAQVVDEYLGG